MRYKQFAVLSFSTLLLLFGCTQTAETPEFSFEPEKSESIADYSSEEPGQEIEDEVVPVIVSISRENSGLDIIPAMEISSERFHPDIIAALDLLDELNEENERFPDEYFQRGIEIQSSTKTAPKYIALSYRWQNTFIDDLTMNSTQADILESLGDPTLTDDSKESGYWAWYYKAVPYYIGFSGSDGGDSIDYVMFMRNIPFEADPNVLETILADLLAEPDLYNFPDWPSSAYLDTPVWTMGGIHYITTPNGLLITYMASDWFEVSIYNNYSGDLFQLDHVTTDTKVSFHNDDDRILFMQSSLLFHREMNDPDQYVSTSSDGRYSVRYHLINSLMHYFEIRDNWELRNPFYIHSPRVGEYGWIEGTHTIWVYGEVVLYDDKGYTLEIPDDSIYSPIISYEPDEIPDTFPPREAEIIQPKKY